MPGRMRDDRRSPEADAYRKLYKTARWQKLRKVQLAAHPLCNRCLQRGRVVKATTVHHVEPHRGDTNLFYRGPFESLCSECHSSHAQQQEVRGYSTEVGADGWPTDSNHPVHREV
jgi:hypothetical protein